MRNYIYVSINLGFKLLSNIFIFFVLAKYWNIDQFGSFVYLVTLSSILVLIVDYGFQLNVVKTISQSENNRKFLLDSIHSKNVLAVITVIFSIIILIFLDNKQYLIFINLIISYIINSYGIFFMLPFRAMKKNYLESIYSIISNGLLFAFVFYSVTVNQDAFIVSIIYILSRLAGLLFAFNKFNKIYKLKINEIFGFSNGKYQIKKNFSYALHLIIGTLYYQIDTIFVQFFEGNHGVGLYQSAIRIILGVLILTEIISIVMLPILSSAFIKEKRFYEKQLKLNFTIHISVGLIFSLIIFLFSDSLIHLLYDPKFFDAIIVLKILTIVLFLRFVNSALGLMLTIEDMQSERAKIVVFGLFVTIILHSIFIPLYHLEGAAFSNIIANMSLIAAYLYVIKRKRRI
ncbi:oligosaccharide flippase family protein [Macrococcus animalis]|uniref:oligosaccharide flippase family protein n=1 Tax=Macrococcus animalis TaxID=3395467 RepID=UPI0039BECFD0